MKVKLEHYCHMREAMRPLVDRIPAHREAIAKEGKSKDVDMRVRWDWMHAAKLTPYVCKELYPYVHDTHIDTALKAIVKELLGDVN
jgi:hypothetical protein